MKSRIIWIIAAIVTLIICFLLCRYAFFSFHGNKDWSVVMLIAALVVLGIAAIFDGRKMMVGTVAGYIGGFALGLLFGTDSTDPGGGATNNWWVIWTISFLVIILVGAVLEIAVRIKNKRRN